MRVPILSPWQDFLGLIRCPALLLSADPALQGVVSPEEARAMQAVCPTLDWVQIQGAGHNLQIDCQDEALAAIHAFLVNIKAK
jgi:pimeloyl-ACP methyl ester carboxylesterase